MEKHIQIPVESLGFKTTESLSIVGGGGARINNVLSVNKDGEIPARFLSGLVSTFSLARTIQEASLGDVTPQVRIFRPIGIFQHVNGVANDVIEEQANEGNIVLQQFHQGFFPETDLFVEEDATIDDNTLQALIHVKEHVEKHCDAETVGAIKESGSKHGGVQGEQNALLYAAHHSFGWNGLHHPGIFQSVPPEVVINTLPPSEKKFTAVRQAITPHIKPIRGITIFDGITHELIINMAGTPHYQFVEDENQVRQEPSFAEVQCVPVVEVFNDMQHRYAAASDKFMKDRLRRVRADMKNLLEFLTSGQLEMRGNETLPQLLAQGLAKT